MNEELETLLKHIQQTALMAYSTGLKDGRKEACDQILSRIQSMCGIPDAGEACRVIIKFCEEIKNGDRNI